MLHSLVLLLVMLQASLATAGSVTYSRGDKQAYLTARGSDSDLPTFDKIKSIRRQLIEDTNAQPSYDDPQKCTTYLAPSSIPNAGLGIFTTIPYDVNSPIGQSEIGILIHDIFQHYPDSDTTKDLFKNYVWEANYVSMGPWEATHGSTMVPGLGMMTNDHPGLTNVRGDKHAFAGRFWEDNDDTATVEGRKHNLNLEDAGRGAYSEHSKLGFHTVRNVEAGDELFIFYGQGWFTNRAEVLGDAIPEQGDYRRTYDTVKQFMENAKKDGLDVNSLGLQQRYEERIYKADWLNESPRMKAAFPKHVSDIPYILQHGAAAYSMKDNKRTVEWIEENGMCVDTLVAAKSTIPQAGNGAFAKRAVSKDDIIVTTPVITMTLNQLKLREQVTGSDWNEYVIHGGFQQILNYCYGAGESTLVFFPSAPVVNFINHGSKEKANAEIRWSSTPHHKAEWLNAPLDEMKTKIKSGLFFDIVATKDIQRGDEILLYYGQDWEESWNWHVKNFNSEGNFTDTRDTPTALDYNSFKERDSIVRTSFELKTNPYHGQVTTRCFFNPPQDCEAPADPSKGVKCQVRSNHTNVNQGNMYHCDILSRFIGENGQHWYTANVTVKSFTNDDKGDKKGPVKKGNNKGKGGGGREIEEYYLVDFIPRYAIRFVDKPYTKDQYSKGAFRHPIGIGEGMMPEEASAPTHAENRNLPAHCKSPPL
ncbi:hypothetical protein ACHAWO_012539 [Cyclotella atomus]|uniref:SET domain-containing protein n=1 Tax=Cyclotella atomus TaxID=382360 RepID=A0ABD3QZE5_9STRA